MNQLFRRKQYSDQEAPSGLLRVLGVWDIVFFGSNIDQFFIIKTDVQVFSQSLADKASVASKHTIDGDNTFCHKDTSFISDRKQEYLISDSFSYFFYNIFR